MHSIKIMLLLKKLIYATFKNDFNSFCVGVVMKQVFACLFFVHISCCLLGSDEHFQWIQFETPFVEQVDANSRWVVGIDNGKDSEVVGFADAVEKQGQHQFLKLYVPYFVQKIQASTTLSVYGSFCRKCSFLQCMCNKYGTARIVDESDIAFNARGFPLVRLSFFQKSLLDKGLEKINYYFPRKHATAYAGVLLNIAIGMSAAFLQCTRYNVKPFSGLIFLYGSISGALVTNRLVAPALGAKPGSSEEKRVRLLGAVALGGGSLLGLLIAPTVLLGHFVAPRFS